MKGIGEKFQLGSNDLDIEFKSQCIGLYDKTRYYSLCREALLAIAENHIVNSKVILLPAYTCKSVIKPFSQSGWKIAFYGITKELHIDIKNLVEVYDYTHPSVLLVHPYYGQGLNDFELQTLLNLKHKGCVLVEDLTQCIFSRRLNDLFDFFVGSYRKWFQIPDGAFLISDFSDLINQPTKENYDYVKKKKEAMLCQKRYQYTDDLFKSDSIQKYIEAEMLLEKNIECHSISKYSYTIIQSENKKLISDKRLLNYHYLYNHISEFGSVEVVCKDISRVTSAPLYFPIYVKNRYDFQLHLMKYKIYSKALWPISSAEVLLSEDLEFIYNNILLLPIDQRYDKTDMDRIIYAIRQYDCEML